MPFLHNVELETTPSDIYVEVKKKIATKQASLGVIGLGYVGLPLALTMSEAGFRVMGLDVDPQRVAMLCAGHSYISDVSDLDIQQAMNCGRLLATADMNFIEELDAISICVPTPLRKTKDPDMSCVLAAVESIATRLRKGQLIILESTTYPGTTEELILPLLQDKGLRVGHDFFLAYSPERIDPGNKDFPTQKIPKVVGGITANCTELAKLLYSQFIEQVHAVSTTRVAETVKLLENTFRSVNIALANEFALFCSHVGIDVWEVIEAARTKPFGFIPFYPGPGLGGHCIPVDPLYLLWKARSDGYPLRFIDLADQINSSMPRSVVLRCMDLLNQKGKAIKGAWIHVMGVTYKANTSDIRESPALEIIKLCLASEAFVSYTDPFFSTLTVSDQTMKSVTLNPAVLSQTDLVLIATDHSQFDYPYIVRHAPLVFDTRNAAANLQAQNLVRL